MASRKLQVPLPEKFWSTAGQDPPLKWSQWSHQLTDFLSLTNAGLPDNAKLSDAEKNRYLRSLLGSEGMRQFSAHPLADSIDTVTHTQYLEAAKSFFGRPTHAIRAHFDFNVRKQGAHETVQEYVIALRTLMVDCDFHGHEKHHLAVQLATGIYSSTTQHKLLAQKDIDLDEFIRIAEAEESSAQDASRIRSDAPVIAAAKFPKSRAGKPHPVSQGQSGKNLVCSFGCGKQGHKYKDFKCPAYNKTCRKCGRLHHFEKLCKSSTGKSVKFLRFSNSTDPRVQREVLQGCQLRVQREAQPAQRFMPSPVEYATRDHTYAAAREANKTEEAAYTDSALNIYTLQRSQSVKGTKSMGTTYCSFACTIAFQAPNGNVAQITAETDSCSDMTGITNSCYKKLFKDVRLQPLDQIVRNFDRSQVTGIRGYFTATATYEGQSAEIHMHVFPDRYGNIFGKDLIRALNIVINAEDGSVGARVRKINSDGMAPKYAGIIDKFPGLSQKSLGIFPDYQHTIVLQPGAVPTIQRSRPIPISRREKAMQEIKKMEDMGIWSRVERSSWVHPIVAVNKPNGVDIRITTDLRSLNKYVVAFQFPLPIIKDMLLRLVKSRFFSKIDFTKAFYHVELDPSCRLYTTTDTPLGLYAYNRMPMGLTDAGAVFQYVVHLTFSEVPRNLTFQDDNLVHAETAQEHDAALEVVLRRAEEKGFRINREKCTFGTEKVTFLGHVIRNGTLQPDPTNLQPISEFPVPTTIKGVQRFLGMINHYADYIPDLATTAEPLRKITRKDVKFQWSNEAQQAMDALKSTMCEKLKLFIYDPNCPTIVTTDASDVAIGGVLSQIQNGQEVPIAFGHHTLDRAQRNYATYEREAYAVLYFCEHWDKFLLGRHFTLRTDHQSLETLLQKGLNARKSKKFERWLERLQCFTYTVEYKKGKENVVADALSRLESTRETDARIRAISSVGITISKLAEQTANDDTLTQLKSYLEGQWPRKPDIESALKPFHTLRKELSVENGCIVRNGYQFVVPRALQKLLLIRAHKGHPGIVRMKRKLRDTYWWPGMDGQVESHIRHCGPCQDSAKSMPRMHIPVGQIPTPEKPWEKVAMDITGPFHVAPQSKRFIVCLIDYYSKFPEIFCTGDITSASVMRWLRDVFSRYGNPTRLVTDNGTQFTSYEFQEFLRSRDIIHDRTPVYNPERNGLVEVFNRYLKHGIQTFQSDSVGWDQGLQDILSNFRATAPSPDGKSPAELFFNRPMRLDFEANRHAAKSRENRETKPPTSPLDDARLPSNLQFRGPFKVGDRVRARLPHVPKGASPFSKPRMVTKVLGNWTYQLDDGSVWNARKLRRQYEQPTDSIDVDEEHPTTADQRRSARSTKNVPPHRYGVNG